MTNASPHSRYPTHALQLLAQLIRRHRIERRLTSQGLADHLGISRNFVHRIENADPGCAVGKVFEAAATVGIRLFDIDHETMATKISEVKDELQVLPRSVRRPRKVKDDF